MSNSIHTIIFDKRTFRFSPYTQHQNVPFGESATIMLYDNAHVPSRGDNVVKLGNEFSAATLGDNAFSILNITLSGLRVDPNIDFTLGDQKVSIRAAEYLVGYAEYLQTLPKAELAKLETDPYALDSREKEWSIEFFRGKLAKLLTASDAFYHLLFRGIDNAMGDFQRAPILYLVNNQNKAEYGSFDLAADS